MIKDIEAIDNDEYLQMFDEVLVKKFGEETPKYQEARQLVLE